MKKIMHFLFCITITSVAWSQEFHVASGGEVTTLPGSVLYVGDDVSVHASGSLTINSDATSSGSLIVTGSATGNVSYKRYVTGSGAGQEWHLVSTPVVSVEDIPTFVGESDNQIAFGGTFNIYTLRYYNNTHTPTFRWTSHKPSPVLENEEALTNFVIGQGYSMSRISSGVFNFTGALNTANVDVPLVTTSPTHFWSCVGNPFPSFLPGNDNANSVANVLKDNISKLNTSFAFLYVWDGTGYVPKRHSDPAFHIAPGQAFMIFPKSNNETFTFSKSLQNHQSGATTFYKSANIVPKIALQLSNGKANKTTKLEFLDQATTGLDVGYDAGTYQDGEPSFAIDSHLVTDSQGIDFTIQSLPTSALDSEISIPLSVRAAANEEITFSMSSENLPEGLGVYLQDVVENTYTNLTDASYKVMVNAALSGIGRFYIHTSSSVLSADDPAFINALNLYKTSNHSIRITGLQTHGNASIKMFGINGNEVMAKQFVSDRVKDIDLPKHLATGVYIVNIVSEMGNTFHKKIIIE